MWRSGTLRRLVSMPSIIFCTTEIVAYGMGSGGHGHLADDRHAGDGRGDGVGGRPASDVARYELDL